MPLIKNYAEAENTWTFVADGVDARELTGPGGVTVPLDQLHAARDAVRDSNLSLGVRLQPEDDPAALEPFLDSLALIEISFPRYTDGRGYSQAQLLRRRYGYDGELRAVGHVLRDQLFYMMRSGFDAFEVAAPDVKKVLAGLKDFSVAYQPAADGPKPAFQLRGHTQKD